MDEGDRVVERVDAEGFAAWLRSRRGELLLTQEELAERTGVSVRTIRDLEAGRAAPRLTTRRLLLEVLKGEREPSDTGLRAAIPAQLPLDAHGFTGRIDELEVLDALLVQARAEPHALVISAVSGTAGVGKTALAVHWAHRVAHRFPDGQLFLDLCGHGPEGPLTAEEALELLLLGLGVQQQELPASTDQRIARYKSLVSARRLLVVLDNASSAEQVRPLLPGSATSVVVVTSRNSLAGLVVRDGARRMELDLLPVADAVALLRSLIDERVESEPQAALDIVERCARLPLALRIAAELAATRPDESLRALATELGDEHRRLDVLDAAGDDRTAVRAVFSWSYQRLPEHAARTFRLLGLQPLRDWDAAAVAALTGVGADSAQQVLDQLARAHLVARTRRLRYGMHDLLRAYAASLALREDGAVDRRLALTRLFDSYVTRAVASVDALFPQDEPHHADGPAGHVDAHDRASAKAWLDGERLNLARIVADSARRQWSGYVIALSQALWRYLFAGAHHAEAAQVHEAALQAARRTADSAAEGDALRHLASVDLRLGRYDQALERTAQALVVHRQSGDRRAEGSALNRLGVIHDRMGRYDQALVHYRQAHAIAVETHHGVAEASTLNNLAVVGERLGRYMEALGQLHDVLTLRRRLDDRVGEGLTLGNLGLVQHALGRYDQAEASYEQALAIARETGERHDEAVALNGLGLLAHDRGRYDEAQRLHERALAIAREHRNRPVEASALSGLAQAVLAAGDVQRSLSVYEGAAVLARELGERHEEARAEEGIARVLRAAGRPASARPHLEAALSLYDDLGAPEARRARLLLSSGAGGAGERTAPRGRA